MAVERPKRKNKALERPPQKNPQKNKAVERPEEWHREQRLRVYYSKVPCYTVFTCDPEDNRDEYNNHFPLTPEGLAKAKALEARGGYGLHEGTMYAKERMPYDFIDDEEKFQAWCKAWNVKL